jgi:multiple sugar transport system substrate-binding protein
VLVYRRDAFEREANRAAAAEKGISLEPPKTWGRLDALARFFQGRDWDGDGQADHGIALVLGGDAEGLGNATFLARSASLGHHPDQFSFLFDSDKMAPRIDAEPFVQALSGLIALKAAGPPKAETFDAAAARQAFRTGKVAMLIDRAESAAGWSHGKPVGVAPLPGSDRVFDPASKTWTTTPQRNAPSYLPRGGGWLVGVRQGLKGNALDAAIDLAKYLSNPEKSGRIRGERAFPMLPFRTAQMGAGLPDPVASPDVDVRLWSEAVGRTFAERAVVGLRIPGADGYMAELAEGRAAAMAGMAPESALANVARAWTERNRARGPKRQLWHYRRSLNLRTPTSQPPPEEGTGVKG